MTLTLDPVTEQRIQREIELGPYRAPAEVIAHALDLLAVERKVILVNRQKALEDSFGAWAHMSEDGLAYQQRMRDEWER